MLRRYFRFSQSGAFGRQNTLLSFQNLMDSWSAPAVPANGARFSSKSNICNFCSEYFDSEIQKVTTEISQTRSRIEVLRKAKFAPFSMDPEWAQRQQMHRDEIDKIELLDRQLRSLGDVKEQELTRLARAQRKQAPHLVSSPPVVFHEQTDGGHKLFVAESIPNSTIVGPVYFSSLVKSNLFEFVQNEQCGDAVGLFIVGPPQSGKSAIIHEVLPAMFASSASNLTRVVVKIKFSRDETMETAISKVVDEVKAVADAFEIQTIGCPSAHATADSGSLKSYQFMYIKSVSRTLRTRHFQLWLLIDDCQVPMINAKSYHEVVEFRRFLSVLISKDDHSIYFVATISNMATYFFTDGDIHFYFQSKIVHLGHAVPSGSWASRVVSEIKSSMVQDLSSDLDNNCHSLRDLDPQLVLNAIGTVPDKLNCRPAIIRHLLHIFSQKQRVDGASVESTLQECVNELSHQLIQQSSADVLIALDDIHRRFDADFVNKLRLIAGGTKSLVSTLFPQKFFDMNLGRKFNHAEFLCSFERFSGETDDVPVLLPPYAHLFKHFEPVENVSVGEDRYLPLGPRSAIAEYARYHVRYRSEFKDQFTADDKNYISEPIVGILLNHGIGARNQCNELIAVRSVFDHPLLCEQHRLSVAEKQFELEKAAYDAWVSSGAVGLPPQGPYPVGLQVVFDLQHLKPFDPRKSVDLSVPQWRMITLDALLNEFTRRFEYTSVGDYGDDRKIALGI